MSKQTCPDCVAFIPHAIEPHWDNVWAPRLAGFPVNIVYAARIEGTGLARHVNIIEDDVNQVTPDGNTVIFGTQCNFVAGFWQYTTNVGGSAHWRYRKIKTQGW